MRARFGWILLLSIYGSALPCQPSAAADNGSPAAVGGSSPRELARHWFEMGVALARAGRFAAAKSLFLEAYAAEPHYLVLYNVAQAEIQLGEFVSAANYLRRFLAEGGSRISPQQLQQLELEIESLEARGPSHPRPPGSSDYGRTPDAVASTRDPPPSQPSNASTSPAPQVTRVVEARAPQFVQIEQELPRSAKAEASGLQRGYLLATGGFAVAGAGIGLFVWNHERHRLWQNRNRNLVSDAGGLQVDGMPPDDATLRGRVAKSNHLLRSVQRFDPIPIVTVAVGLAAIGAGVWLLRHDSDSHTLQLSVSPVGAALHRRWRW